MPDPKTCGTCRWWLHKDGFQWTTMFPCMHWRNFLIDNDGNPRALTMLATEVCKHHEEKYECQESSE